jgi:hypothetical protein
MKVERRLLGKRQEGDWLGETKEWGTEYSEICYICMGEKRSSNFLKVG